ncbi:hypothetical protein ONS95_008535 [Cadophora gregata]|uniref:uncharacterized protein n=1 Tax=Cadophora gregata TaxID=51156 RepID=UPI0026DBAB45|nr:uncharacterized protein ONS95_008535 [Cadophora gregata]KAK0100197.1 hypothetical protein ONS95_008535 [Cadophora gregata]KAK0114854.1 hypothetical protein ONS96_013335 [Cadophora gregata f. sp. sojae]
MFLSVGVDIPPESLDHIPLIETMKNTESFISLDQMLYLTRRFSVSLPRDHVIDILGLASDINADDINLLANYVDSTTDYFKIFMQWSIEKNKNLDCLSSDFDPANISDSSLPSWMPDVRSWDRQPGMPRSMCGFKAAMNSVPNMSFSSETSQLQITGSNIDQIATLGTMPPENVDLDLVETDDHYQDHLINSQLVTERDRTWLLECKSIATSDFNTPDSPGFLFFIRTLIWNMPGTPNPYSPEQLSTIFEQYIRETETRTHDDAAPYIDPVVISFVGTFSVGRRFARTTSGRLGSMPRFAVVGDRICLFEGGRMPYVVRPYGGGRYTFLGDCYLDGVMYGEGMVEGRKVEEFSIV